jgi:hypothetical protein
VSFNTQTELAALVLTVAVHIVGATALIWGMIDHDDPDRGSWRDWWPNDGRGDDDTPLEPDPTPSGDTIVPVLPSSAPAPARGNRSRPPRIGDLAPRRERRPAHPAPAPAPERAPARDAG